MLAIFFSKFFGTVPGSSISSSLTAFLSAEFNGYFIEVLSVFATAVGKQARWLGACHCHDEILTGTGSRKRSLDLHLASGEAGEEAEVRVGRAIAGRGRAVVVLDTFDPVLRFARSSVSLWLDLRLDSAARDHPACSNAARVQSLEPLALLSD